MSKILKLMETQNGFGEKVKFGICTDFHGYWNGTVVGLDPELDFEEGGQPILSLPYYGREWEEFLKDYPEFKNTELPQTFPFH